MILRRQCLRLSSIAASGCCPASQSAWPWPCVTAPADSPASGQRRHILAGLAGPIIGAFAPKTDPFALVQSELRCVSERLKLGVTSDIPALQQAAGYLFESGSEGKRIRPSVCLLISSALSATPPSRDETERTDLRPVSVAVSEMRRRQQRIAEIAELIHVASLLHDDVIDGSETRRGRTVLNLVLGNKVAILAGDFLLARASMTLASLEDTVVVKLMSQILEDLVGGEIMQATASPEKLLSMDHYLAKTYHKTASLLANAAKATAVVSGASPDICEAAFQYGRNVGLAFQVTDDILDFTATSMVLGKPALGDIKAGVITCPVLYAAEEHPSLLPMIQRKFRTKGDVEHAIECVRNSAGIDRARALAQGYIDQAIACVELMPAAQTPHAALARQALLDLCAKIIDRKK